MRCAVPDKRLVAASFSRAAERYDDHAVLQREVADDLLALVNTQRPVRRILDIGSGTGYCSAPLLRKFPGAQLISLDIAPGMLSHARGRYGEVSGVGPGEGHGGCRSEYCGEGIEEGNEEVFQAGQEVLPGTPREIWLCGDAEALPLTDDSIDLVISSLAIQWCSDYRRLFGEVCRVARPGAQCLFSTFDRGTLEELRQAWACVDDGVHVNHFQSADVLRAQLEGLPVDALRSEIQVQQRLYPGLRALTTELKAIGAHNMNPGQQRGLTTRKTLSRLEAAFMADAGPRGRAVTWALHYLGFTVATRSTGA